MSWIDDKARAELTRVREAQAQQVYPFFRKQESGGLHTTIEGKPVVNFSSNDYLGLTNHPKVKEAAKKAVEQFAGMAIEREQVAYQELDAVAVGDQQRAGTEAANVFFEPAQLFVRRWLALAGRVLAFGLYLQF